VTKAAQVELRSGRVEAPAVPLPSSMRTVTDLQSIRRVSSISLPSTQGLMNGVRHVIESSLNPRVLSEMTSHDVASTIHQFPPPHARASRRSSSRRFRGSRSRTQRRGTPRRCPWLRRWRRRRQRRGPQGSPARTAPPDTALAPAAGACACQGLALAHFSAQPTPFWLHLPVSPSLIDWGIIMHPTYPTKWAYVEPKSGRV